MLILPKLNKKIILYLIGAVIVILICAGLIFLFLIYFKPSITKCENEKCVKKIVLSANFNPEDCEKVAENLRNDCYYTYEIGNLISKKTKPGQYCWSIKNEELRASCIYETLGMALITTNVRENLPQAVTSLNTENCSKINRTEWKEQCIKDIGIVKKALDEKNIFLCFKSTDISFYAREICVRMLQHLL